MSVLGGTSLPGVLLQRCLQRCTKILATTDLDMTRGGDSIDTMADNRGHGLISTG